MTDKNNFNPDDAATDSSGIFGLSFSAQDAAINILPVPWEATTSYGSGTSLGPQAILRASKQVDLFELELGRFYEQGICLLEESKEVSGWNNSAKALAQKIILHEFAAHQSQAQQDALNEVNTLSEKLNHYVYGETKKILAKNKIPGVVGGDHSTPFGAIQACLEKYPQMGVLHFDAHADLRNAYAGFKFSHASIMHNVIHQTALEKLVQVGIRDFCESEFLEIQNSKGRIQTFFDQKLHEEKFNGVSWASLTNKIIAQLPNEVYISFDIDGLDPLLCPHTGTPVPGGLSFQEAVFVIKAVSHSGRKIVGFDLNEVAPGPDGNEWDANVGARLLYKLCGWALASHKNK
jgi:agmatinase